MNQKLYQIIQYLFKASYNDTILTNTSTTVTKKIILRNTLNNY